MIRKAILAGLALLAACSDEQPGDPGKPAGYALQAKVTPAAGGNPQRVVLPPAALAALKRSDAADVRLFDAAGKPLALARDDFFGAGARRTATTVPSSPIAMPSGVGGSRVKVTVGQSEQSVTVDAVNAEAEAESNPQAALLLDTRKLTDPAVELGLQVALPAHRELALNIERSEDLRQWAPLTSKVLFRFDSTGGNGEQTYRIALPGTPLKDSYLRVSWRVAPDVDVHGGEIVTMHEVPPAPLVMPAEGARLADPRTLSFRPPAGLPQATLRVTGSGHDGIVPLGLEARNGPDSPWSEVSAGVLRDGQSLDLPLSGSPLSEYRLRADERSAGFSSPPRLDLLVEPVALLAAFNGNGPFRLAVGNAAAPYAYFDADTLRGTQSPDAPLPEAKVEASAAPVLKLEPASQDGPFTPRKVALWGALLAATAVLVIAAIRLMRASASPPAG